MPISRRQFHLTAAGTALFARPASAADDPGIRLALIEDRVIHGATFQSNNQKVTWNRRGLFATYIRTRNKDYTAQSWRLAHSTDGGHTFKPRYEATHATNPPVIETDTNDNLYVVRPDFVTGNAHLLRFLAKDDYRQPRETLIPRGSAGKYALEIDESRGQLYYFAHNDTFHILGLDGQVRSARNLTAPGKNAALQYPHLCLAPDGSLYAAWTTVAHGRYLYWDIHAIRSDDGGTTWRKLDGTPLKEPIVADDSGPADRITRDDEFADTTWLCNLLATKAKLHFFYETQAKPFRMRYVRIDRATGQIDRDSRPTFRGEKLSILSLDGFFAAGNGKLYCVSKDAERARLVCLRSDDEGGTWHDHAASAEVTNPYAIGGCRKLSPDGQVIGTFTDCVEPSDAAAGKSRVMFAQIQG